MRKALLVILAVGIGLSAFAQATQPCVVMKYNKKEAKSPLSGVEVWVNNAGSKTSDEKGELTLVFRTLKPGDRVSNVQANKGGYVIFNTEAVEQWFISRDQTPFTLVLVDKAYFEQLKSTLTQTSTANYRKKYEQATKDLEDALAAGKMKEEEFNQKYDELDSWYQEQLKNLDNYIDQFARIDLSEVSAEEQRILELVEQGQIDEAVKAYEDLDLMDKLRTARENAKALADAKTRIEKEETAQKQAIEDLKGKLDREIATLKLAGGKENYDKIGRILKENALADTTDVDAVWKYAAFAYEQKDYKDAELFFLSCLNNCNGNLYQLSSLQNNLGYLYLDLQDYLKSEQYLLQAVQNETILFKQNPDQYRVVLAGTQNNLGLLYNYLQDYPKAEQYLLQAIENKTFVFSQNPNDSRRADLAKTQNNLGILYHDLGNITKAEEYYLLALDNKTILADKYPDDIHLGDLAGTQNNLGILFSEYDNYSKAEYFYLQAIQNYERIFTHNPESIRASLSITQYNLGVLYDDNHDYSKAEEYYLQALDNYMVSYLKQPDLFRAKVADTQYTLLHVYAHDNTMIEQYDSMLDAALSNFEVLFLQNRDLQPVIVELRNRKGRRFLGNGHTDESLRLFESTYELNPKITAPDLASSLNTKAYEYLEAGDIIKALGTIDRAIEIMPNNANYYDSKGEILLKMGDEKGALEMWRKVLEVAPETWTEYEVSDLYKQLKERGLIEE